MELQHERSCLVVWREREIIVEMNQGATLKEFGEKLQELTSVKADTLRLLIPTENSSKMLYPFSDEHSSLRLDSTLVLKGKSVRMMGVPKEEVDELLQNVEADLRIAGFDQEEKRLKQRNSHRSYILPKLPQGNYIFCDFQSLSLPGIELNPPASKALGLLHKLASDPGIVAIMNKHRWRVRTLTEMAPIGYVGISPKCILGINKNHGEEISLRLRTDDLKGFRKYESIKKTLLHELAHMVFTEHDSSFYALDSQFEFIVCALSQQLNKEAANLDWTKSRGHTLIGDAHSRHYEEFDIRSNVTSSQKLGGQAPVLPNPRAASVNAAFERLANTFSGSSEENIAMHDPVVHSNQNISEPYPDDYECDNAMVVESYVESGISFLDPNINKEIQGPGLDNSEENPNHLGCQSTAQLDGTEFLMPKSLESHTVPNGASLKPHPNDNTRADSMQTDIDSAELSTGNQTADSGPNESEFQIIQDPVTMVCGRLQSAIQSLKYEGTTPLETERVLQILMKIICNVIEHPDDMKFKRLRKANPIIRRNVITYKAAMDVLALIGFCEVVINDEWGMSEAYLMLKRNDPGLLWLAKSSLEMYIDL
ncbi:hypothetical protein OROGR_007432 [Orobanche gracilis]